jgi:hypothetical protein
LKASKAFDYDTKWLKRVQNGVPPPYQFVTEDPAWSNPRCWEKLRSQRDKKLDHDVIISGGPIGIFFALALQLKGLDVCVLDGADLIGDETEWTMRTEDLLDLHGLGILTEEDIEIAMQTTDAGFNIELLNEGGPSGNSNWCLSPDILIKRVALRFKEGGGTILTQTPMMGIAISEYSGAAVDLGEERGPITATLIVDTMGSKSPISRQQRYGMKPDAVCAVVGTMAAGFDDESKVGKETMPSALKLRDDSGNKRPQYFWETAPAGKAKKRFLNSLQDEAVNASSTKTTYMFTYIDADEERPSFESLMADYWRMLASRHPSIHDPVTDLDVQRVMFSYHPIYRETSSKPRWNRILDIGSIQSPFSSAGLGSVARHIGRISKAVTEAIDNHCLHKDDLAEIISYNPSLSASWMFRKAMSIRMGEEANQDAINRLLATNFKSMHALGQQATNPFLQDVVCLDTLLGTMSGNLTGDPSVLPAIVEQVGLPTFLDWMKHVSMMGVYDILDTKVAPQMEDSLDKLAPREKFKWLRRLEAWKVGSGNDYNMLNEDGHDEIETKENK